jgi:hypothetical protein
VGTSTAAQKWFLGVVAGLALVGCGDSASGRGGAGRGLGDDAQIRDLDAGLDLREGTLELPFAGEVEVLYAVIDGQAFWTGDMVLGDADDLENGFRAATVTTSLWPDGTVKYMMDAPEPVAGIVKAAMDDWVAAAGVRFVEVSPAEQAAGGFLRVVDTSEGCWANYGAPAAGAEHVLNLGSGCEYPGVARHELGHVLGMIHEQSRADRDDHVTIDWNNVQEGKAFNFDQYTKVGTPGVDRGEYDFDSLMHYPSDAFAIDPSKPTIARKDGGLITRGTDTAISAGDAMAVRAMYEGGAGDDGGPTDDPNEGDGGGAGAAGSCAGHCGSTTGVATAEGGECYCDPGCTEYGDCCADRESVCDGDGGGEPTDGAGTCAGQCGSSDPQTDATGGNCYCDEACTGNGDCCSDHATACGGTGDPDPNPDPGTGGSCAGYCGGAGSQGESCYCDSECTANGDCCSDFASVCDGGGGDSGGGGSSCSGHCGSEEPTADGCYCDVACVDNSDCCADYGAVCG